MSALDRLKEKVEAWKERIAQLEEENTRLQEQLEAGAADSQEVETLKAALNTCEETVASLRQEIADKDEEIEEIIAKVEALLA